MPDPNKIEGGRWDRVLRSLFNLKGAGSTAARISDDISPTFNFPFRAEDDFLLGEKHRWAVCKSNAAGLDNPRCILTNVSVDTLLIVDKILFNFSGTGAPYIGTTSAVVPFVAAVPIYPRDGRQGALQTDIGVGTARVQEAPLVGAPTPANMWFLTGADLQVMTDIVVLAPGDSIFYTNGTVATFCQCTFFWREHVMEPGERA